jgi:hypothetical protein
MGWLQNKMPNFPINNFTTDWKDGRKVRWVLTPLYTEGVTSVYGVREGRVSEYAVIYGMGDDECLWRTGRKSA